MTRPKFKINNLINISDKIHSEEKAGILKIYCNKNYIGKTSRTFKIRQTEHEQKTRLNENHLKFFNRC